MKYNCIILLAITLALLATACKKDNKEEPIIITAADDIQAAVDEYRALLGVNNGGIAGSQAQGRREINWDGVPDELAAPYNLPSDFFNTDLNNRARGAVLTSPGTGVQVSADSDNPTGAATSFGNINPTYTQLFPPFSGERIFSPVGSNIVNLHFYVPGTTTKAVVSGFGAIYISVNRKENTSLEYFDINDKSLGRYGPQLVSDGHVFLGVFFKEPVVHHVRIEYGNAALGPNANESSTVDVAVMDDFIFGEPQAAQ